MLWFEKYLVEDSDDSSAFWNDLLPEQYENEYDPVFGIEDFVSDAGIRSGIYEPPTDAQYASFLSDDPISLIGDDYKIGEKEPTLAGKTRDFFGIDVTGTKLLKAIGSKVAKGREGRFGTPRADARGMPRGVTGNVSPVASLQARKSNTAKLIEAAGNKNMEKAIKAFLNSGYKVTNNQIKAVEEVASRLGSGAAGPTTKLNPALRQLAIRTTARG
jgi:hypothetical protein